MDKSDTEPGGISRQIGKNMICITDISMPRGCFECPCQQYSVHGEYDPFCKAVETEPTVTDEEGRPAWCPLIEVPDIPESNW